MIRPGWFALLVCVGLALAGCQKMDSDPASSPADPASSPADPDAAASEMAASEAMPPEAAVSDAVDGQKVFGALSSALQKGVTRSAVSNSGSPASGGGDASP